MGKRIGGGLLLLLALFMLVGFLNADVDRSAGTTVLALLLTVALPAAAGVVMLRGAGGRKRLAQRREVLRQQTLAAELVRLAGQRGGKLTAVEVLAEFAVTAEEAEAALRDLAVRGVAEPEVTESGLLVYAFPDVRLLDEKPGSRGVLE